MPVNAGPLVAVTTYQQPGVVGHDALGIRGRARIPRQAGQSLGVSVTGAVFAAGMHGPLQEGFAHAGYPAWLVMAGCGTAVLLLGMATHRQARQGAAPRPASAG